MVLSLWVASCRPASADKVVPLLPNGVAKLLIVYKKGTTNEQINYFLDNELAHPRADGRGSESLPGIRLQARQSLQEHNATVIGYFSYATPEQREEIKRAAVSSPIVYKVFEDVVPSQIKRIE